jgi:hypothetical protein
MAKPLRISFNGAVVPYYYRCPQAYKLRNVDKIFPPQEEPDPDVPLSKRALGIIHHKETATWLSDLDAPAPDFITETLQSLREAFEAKRPIYLEHEIAVPLGGSFEAPEGSILTARPDAFLHEDGHVDLYDFKFGSTEYGAPQYYEECEFFLFALLESGFDFMSATVNIHYPIDDFTLPVKTFSGPTLFLLRGRWEQRIKQVLNDKFLRPIPSRYRCDFCDYRAESSGGSGDCEYSLV